MSRMRGPMLYPTGRAPLSVWVAVTFLLCLASGAVQQQQQQQQQHKRAAGTLEIRQVQLRHLADDTNGADTSDVVLSRYRVAFFYMQFRGGFVVESRDRDKLWTTQNTGQDSLGLTRLRCDCDGHIDIFDSHPTSALFSHPGSPSSRLPHFLIPADANFGKSIHEWLPKTLNISASYLNSTQTRHGLEALKVADFLAAHLRSLRGTQDSLAYCLLLEGEDAVIPPIGEQSHPEKAAPSTVRSTILEEGCISNCTMQFLHHQEQSWEPQKRVVLQRSRRSYFGRNHLVRQNLPSLLLGSEVVGTGTVLAGLHDSRVATINNVLTAYDRDGLGMTGHADNTTSSELALNRSFHTAILPQTAPQLVGMTDNMTQATASLIESSARVGANQGVGTLPVDGIVDKYMKAQAKDVLMSNKIVGAVGEAVRDSVEANAAAVSVLNDAQIINEVLKRLLSGHLSRALTPALAETITSSTEDTASYLFQRYLTSEMTAPLERGLVSSLTDSLTVSIPKFVNQIVPKHVSRLLVKNLGHVLPRSISHSLIPALVHTLTHSPLQDYYCFYCFHHKIYCQYCQYSPSQLFYALFYAGYYSTYYTDYYQEWMYRKMAQPKPSQMPS